MRLVADDKTKQFCLQGIHTWEIFDFDADQSLAAMNDDMFCVL